MQLLIVPGDDDITPDIATRDPGVVGFQPDIAEHDAVDDDRVVLGDHKIPSDGYPAHDAVVALEGQGPVDRRFFR